MPVVSISLDDESSAALDSITEALGLKGRSESVRFAIKTATAELREMEDFSGTVEGVMIMVHGSHGDRWITQVQHRYGDIIKTQLHSHLQDRNCLEVMIISGDGSSVRDMMREIHSSGCCRYLKFVRS